MPIDLSSIFLLRLIRKQHYALSRLLRIAIHLSEARRRCAFHNNWDRKPARPEHVVLILFPIQAVTEPNTPDLQREAPVSS